MLMDVSVSIFSTASTSPFSTASCNLVFLCRFLLQVTLSISSLVSRPSLSTHKSYTQKIVCGGEREPGKKAR